MPMVFISPDAKNAFQWRFLARVTATIGVATLAGCALAIQSSENPPQTLVITGSSSVAPLMNEIGKQYERDFPNARVDVQTGGSSRGIADARAGTADIGMVSRALTEKEADLQAYPVASDGLAILVHQSNPIAALNREQIKQIFSKQVQQWSDVGGQDAPITVVNKAEGRSTLEVFQAFFQFEPKQIKADVIIGDNQQGLKTVAANPNAIGYVSIGAAQLEIERGEPLKLLSMDGVDPTLDNVQNASYPLRRVLNIVTPKGQTSVAVQQFIDYATSSKVNLPITQQQLIPVASEG